ncbi:MAG: hypothetical protein ACK5SI_12995, partial [Planctomycetia bacterium]
AYHRLRPLSVAERAVLPVLMATGVVFGLDNWFRWLIEEKRRFHQPERVLGRIDRLLEDLPAALDFLAVQADRGGLTGGNCSWKTFYDDIARRIGARSLRSLVD